MVRRYIVLLILLFACIFLYYKVQRQTEKKYIDAIIKGEKLFALTSSGHINIFNTNTEKSIDINIHADTAITAINIDRKGNIIIVKANNKVDRLNEKTLMFKNFFTSPAQVYSTVFDQSNRAYLIADKGIIDVSSGKTYLPDSSFRLNHQLRGWSEPSAVIMDMNDNIWVGSGHGEWGGELFVFSTKQNKYIKLAENGCCLEPVQSIFADDGTIYVSSGLDHMITSGCITKFSNFKCSQVFSSQTYWKGNPQNKKPIVGEYIGPALFNKKDSSIYFYSQHGIFKGNKEKNLSKIDAWTKIVSPKLKWTYGQAKAVGSQMNVLKMNFSMNGKLFVLTQNDGIGVYNGKTFRLLN